VGTHSSPSDKTLLWWTGAVNGNHSFHSDQDICVMDRGSMWDPHLALRPDTFVVDRGSKWEPQLSLKTDTFVLDRGSKWEPEISLKTDIFVVDTGQGQ